MLTVQFSLFYDPNIDLSRPALQKLDTSETLRVIAVFNTTDMWYFEVQ